MLYKPREDELLWITQKPKHNGKNSTFSHQLQFRILQLRRAVPIKSGHGFMWMFYTLFKMGWCGLNSAQSGPKNKKALGVWPKVEHPAFSAHCFGTAHPDKELWAFSSLLWAAPSLPQPKGLLQTLCSPANTAIKNNTIKKNVHCGKFMGTKQDIFPLTEKCGRWKKTEGLNIIN